MIIEFLQPTNEKCIVWGICYSHTGYRQGLDLAAYLMKSVHPEQFKVLVAVSSDNIKEYSLQDYIKEYSA